MASISFIMNNTAEFISCFFENNQASFSGVVHIVCQDGNAIFRDCIFSGNYALALWTTPFGVGSVFAIGGSKNIVVYVYTCFFAENFAYINGKFEFEEEKK